MQIKTTMRDHLTPWSEWPSSKSLQTLNVGEGVEKKELSYTVGGNANWYSQWRFLKKLEKELPHDLAIPLWGKYTKKTRTERDACNPVFIAALFTIARIWKQPRVHWQTNV